MTKTMRTMLILLLGLAWNQTAPEAHAQGRTGVQDQSTRVAKRPSRADRQKAREMFREAQKAMGAGKYQLAGRLLEQAYQLDPQDEILYSLGVAYHEMSEISGEVADAKKALDYYVKYLRTGATGVYAIEAQLAVDELRRLISNTEEKLGELAELKADLKAAQTEVGDLQSKLRTETEARQAAEIKAEAGERTAAELTEVSADRDLWRQRALAGGSGQGGILRYSGVALLAAGGISLGLGMLHGIEAMSIRDELADGSQWTELHRDLDARGQSHNTQMIVFTSLGSAALIGGGILYFLGERAATEVSFGDNKIAIIPAVTPAAATVQIEGRF